MSRTSNRTQRCPVTVVASRDDTGWRAEVTGLGLIGRAPGLAALDHQVRAVLGRRPVLYRFRTGDPELDRLVIEAHIARLTAQRHDERARRLTGQILMTPGGGSIRDLAVLLDLSYQRVHQLLQARRKGLR